MQKEKVEILGVKFDVIDTEKAVELAMDFAKDTHQHYINTPNPEIVLKSLENKELKDILNNSSLNIADGTGILWASKYLHSTEKTKSKLIKFAKWALSLCSIPFYPKYIRTVLPARVTGTDLMQKICAESAKHDLRIFLLGASEGTAEKAKEKLEKKYKDIKIVGTFAGSPKEKDETTIIEKINHHSPVILFVAYGAPAQEFWIKRNLKKLPSIKLAMGVGGAFDFIAGTKRRAPMLARKIGLEWLYRLIQEPKRIRRIYNATIKFPVTVLKK